MGNYHFPCWDLTFGWESSAWAAFWVCLTQCLASHLAKSVLSSLPRTYPVWNVRYSVLYRPTRVQIQKQRWLCPMRKKDTLWIFIKQEQQKIHRPLQSCEASWGSQRVSSLIRGISLLNQGWYKSNTLRGPCVYCHTWQPRQPMLL